MEKPLNINWLAVILAALWFPPLGIAVAGLAYETRKRQRHGEEAKARNAWQITKLTMLLSILPGLLFWPTCVIALYEPLLEFHQNYTSFRAARLRSETAEQGKEWITLFTRPPSEAAALPVGFEAPWLVEGGIVNVRYSDGTLRQHQLDGAENCEETLNGLYSDYPEQNAESAASWQILLKRARLLDRLKFSTPAVAAATSESGSTDNETPRPEAL